MKCSSMNKSIAFIAPIILLAFILLVHAKSADASGAIYNKTIRTGNNFTIEGESYLYRMQSNTFIAQITGKYLELIISEGDCKTIGYYTFCLGFSERDEIIEYADIRLSVTKSNCTTFYDWNFTKRCKNNVGGFCVEDEGCISNDCHHGLCTFEVPICGDGFCDKNEKCSPECNATVQPAKDELKFTLDSRIAWQQLNITLKKDLQYNISTKLSYKLNQTGQIINNSQLFYQNQTNCPDLPIGRPIMNVCGSCLDLSEKQEIVPKSDCRPSAMVNEHLLYDNYGTFEISIADPNWSKTSATTATKTTNATTPTSNAVLNQSNNNTINITGNMNLSNNTSKNNNSINGSNTTSQISTNNSNTDDSSKPGNIPNLPRESGSSGDLLKILLAVTGAIILFSIIFAIIIKRRTEKDDEKVW